jgi:hypothetical protein
MTELPQGTIIRILTTIKGDKATHKTLNADEHIGTLSEFIEVAHQHGHMANVAVIEKEAATALACCREAWSLLAGLAGATTEPETYRPLLDVMKQVDSAISSLTNAIPGE